MNPTKTILLSLASLALVVAAGCQSSSQPVKVVVLAPKPAPPAPPPLKVVQRSPGSLWSEDSRWNEMYSNPTSRLVGDVVTFRIDEVLRSKILAQMPAEVDKKKKTFGAGGKNAAGETEKDVKKREFEEAKAAKKRNDEYNSKAIDKINAEAEGKLATKPGESPDGQFGVVNSDKSRDSRTLEASIRQVLPRGQYFVYGSQIVTVDGKTAVVTFDGQVRERDIDQHLAPGESITNLRLDVETKESKIEEEGPRAIDAETAAAAKTNASEGAQP